MPANTACAGVAPKASTMRGRCAAIAEGSVVEAEPHADAQQQPRHRPSPDRGRCAEQRETTRENEIGDAKNLPPPDAVDLPPDARAQQSRDHERGREGREEPVAGNPEV